MRSVPWFAKWVADKDMFARRKRNYGVAIISAIVVIVCMLIVALAWPEGASEKPPADDDAVQTQGSKSSGIYSSGSAQNSPDDKDTPDSHSTPDANDALQRQDNYSGGDIEARSGEAGTATEDGDRTADNVTDDRTDSYYLLKLDGSAVRVFFVYPGGASVKLEDTEIDFDALNPTDQKLLKTGLKAESQEALFELLQDFDE